MSVERKKLLSVIVYYTLAALAILSAAFFVFALSVRDVALWAKIVYYIWSGFVVGVVIFDIICTSSNEGKHVSGIIIYVLSVLAVIMACILYFLNSGVAGLATELFNIFLSVSLLSLMTTGYTIATWCVGESLVEHRTAQREIERNRMQSK